MKIIKLPNTNIKLIIKEGEYEDDNCDVIINWISSNITNSPACFFNLKQKAGDQFYYSLLPLKDRINYCDAFTTHAGLLNANIVLNCVVPPIPELYNDSFFRIKETLKTYSKDKLCRFVTLTIPDLNYDHFLYNLQLYFRELTTLREVRLIVNNKRIYNSILEKLKLNTKDNFLLKIKRFLPIVQA